MPEKPENKYKKWIKFFLPFFHLSSNPSDALKSGISNFSAKKNPFSFFIYPSIGIFWLLCKTNHSNRAWSTFLYWQPRNFLVLGALSSSAWKFFSLFLIQVEMVFLGTPNLLTASLFLSHLSLCVTECHTFPSKFSYSAYFWQTFLFWRHWEQETIFFHLRSKLLFWFKFVFIRELEMKFEYVNVRDRERKWFKGPENLFDIGKSSR